MIVETKKPVRDESRNTNKREEPDDRPPTQPSVPPLVHRRRHRKTKQSQRAHTQKPSTYQPQQKQRQPHSRKKMVKALKGEQMWQVEKRKSSNQKQFTYNNSRPVDIQSTAQHNKHTALVPAQRGPVGTREPFSCNAFKNFGHCPRFTRLINARSL